MADIKILSNLGGVFSSELDATSADVLSPYTYQGADTNDEKGTGTISSKSAQTYNASTSNQTITSNQYLSGNQTIRQLVTNVANPTPSTNGNVKKGVVIQIKSNNQILRQVTGTYTNTTGTAITAASILSGYAGYVNGGNQINGTIPLQAAQTVTPGTGNKTIVASGRYLSGVQMIKGDANLKASNIVGGKSIFGVAGTTGTYALNYQSNLYGTTWIDGTNTFPTNSPFYNKNVLTVTQEEEPVEDSEGSELYRLYWFRASSSSGNSMKYLIRDRYAGYVSVSFPFIDFEVQPYRGFQIVVSDEWYDFESKETASSRLLNARIGLIPKNAFQTSDFVSNGHRVGTSYYKTWFYKYTTQGGAIYSPTIASMGGSVDTSISGATLYTTLTTWTTNFPSSGKYFIALAFSGNYGFSAAKVIKLIALKR